MVFRYGGEEFAVILTETDIQNAIIPCERLRKNVETYPFIYNGQPFNVTISAGVCEKDSSILSAFDLFEKTDKALYQAKETGRNQVKAAL